VLQASDVYGKPDSVEGWLKNGILLPVVEFILVKIRDASLLR